MITAEITKVRISETGMEYSTPSSPKNTNMKWGHAQNYHLTLDSGVVEIDRCVEIIAGLY